MSYTQTPNVGLYKPTPSTERLPITDPQNWAKLTNINWDIVDAMAILPTTLLSANVANLPTIGVTVGTMYNVLDGIRGVWIYRNGGWSSLTGYADVRDFVTGGSGTSGSPWTGWEAGLSALPSDTTIYFAPGYFRATSAWTTAARNRIIGAGRYATYVMMDRNLTGIYLLVVNVATSGPDGHVYIADLTFHNEHPETATISAVNLSAGAPETVFSNVGFTRFSRYGINANNSWSVRVRDCYFDGINEIVGSGSIGIAIFADAASNNWSITNNTFIRVDRVLDLTPFGTVTNLTFENNDIELVGYRYHTDGSTIDNTNFTVYYAVVTDNLKGLSYNTNYHEGVRGILIECTSCTGTISNNYVAGEEPVLLGGSVVLNTAVSLVSCRGLDVYGNTVIEYNTAWLSITSSGSDNNGEVLGAPHNNIIDGGSAAIFPSGTSGVRTGLYSTDSIRTTRLRATLGTALVDGDIALSAGWGTGASVSAVSGTDQRFKLTISSPNNGTANPTATLIFKDGTWITAPFAVVSRNGGDQPSVLPTWTTTATTLVITFPGTPVAGQTYTFEVVVMG